MQSLRRRKSSGLVVRSTPIDCGEGFAWLLLVAQGVDWIELRRFERGIKSRDDTDKGAAADGDAHPHGRKLRRPAEFPGNVFRGADAEEDSDGAADKTERDSFG